MQLALKCGALCKSVKNIGVMLASKPATEKQQGTYPKRECLFSIL